MYKVFFNQKLIAITDSPNITLIKTQPFFTESLSKTDIKKWFEEFAGNDQQEVNLVHPEPDGFFHFFQSAFKVIHAAGGVVLKQGRVLFIFRNGKWDLPKGKIDKGESNEEAALREVEEECGIGNLQILKKLPSTFHIYKSTYKKSPGEWIFKETFWFEMSYGGNDYGIPQQEEGITEIRWMERSELNTVLENTYENLKQIIDIYRV